jgi:MbtH protein
MTEPEVHVVLRNQEDQYSVWWADHSVPDGWEVVGEPAPKDECLARIDELWTDMRPLSLRRWMDERAVGE